MASVGAGIINVMTAMPATAILLTAEKALFPPRPFLLRSFFFFVVVPVSASASEAAGVALFWAGDACLCLFFAYPGVPCVVCRCANEQSAPNLQLPLSAHHLQVGECQLSHVRPDLHIPLRWYEHTGLSDFPEGDLPFKVGPEDCEVREPEDCEERLR